MLPDRVSNPGPPTYESGALPIALRGPAETNEIKGVSLVHDTFSWPPVVLKNFEFERAFKLLRIWARLFKTSDVVS